MAIFQHELRCPIVRSNVVVAVLFMALAFCVLPAPFASADMNRVMVKGVPVEVRSGDPPLVIVGDAVLKRYTTATSVRIVGIYAGAGRTYVLVAVSSGAAVCPMTFSAIDMSAPQPKVSDEFGTCSDLPKTAVKEGGLVVEFPLMDGSGTETVQYKDGLLTSNTFKDDLSGEGDAQAPGGDLAAYVAGKHVSEALRLKAVVAALKAVLPSDRFDEALKMALSGPGTDFEADNEFAVARACERHNCGDHSVRFAFDHRGGAWAAISNGSKVAYYGDPSASIRWLLIKD